MSVRLLAGLLALCLAASGCDQYSLPDPPSEKERASWGPVGVVAPRAPRPASWPDPVSGWCTGLAVGALHGAEGMLVITGATIVAGFLVGGAFGLMFAVLLFPVQIVGGAFTAEDPARADFAVGVLAEMFARADLGTRLRRTFIERARQEARATVVDFESCSEKERESVQTLLELGIDEYGLYGKPWEIWTVNPPLRPGMSIRARLVRRDDRRVLYESTLRYGTEKGGMKLVEWADQGAALLEGKMGRITDLLGGRMMEEIFMLHLLPRDPRE